MDFKQKVFVGLLGMVAFWFLIFYPVIVPAMIAGNTYPLLAVALFELTFFITIYLATLFIFGEAHKHSLKIAGALFLVYHVVDSVEPPFILNFDGTWALQGTSYIVSWDYGVSYFLTHTFGITGANLFYLTNIGFVALMIVAAMWILKREQTISRVVREALQ